MTPQIKEMPEPMHIPHILLPTSLKNLVVKNGGIIFLHTPSWRVYNFHVHSPFLITHASFIYKLWCCKLDILLHCWEDSIWSLHPSLLCFSNPHSQIPLFEFHCLGTPIPFLLNALVGSFTLLYIISKLYLCPYGYGVVVLVGLMFY